jgi:hypothetical protein
MMLGRQFVELSERRRASEWVNSRDWVKTRKLSFGRVVQAMIAGFPLPVIEREDLPGRLSRFQFASMKSSGARP